MVIINGAIAVADSEARTRRKECTQVVGPRRWPSPGRDGPNGGSAENNFVFAALPSVIRAPSSPSGCRSSWTVYTVVDSSDGVASVHPRALILSGFVQLQVSPSTVPLACFSSPILSHAWCTPCPRRCTRKTARPLPSPIGECSSVAYCAAVACWNFNFH